MCTECITYRDKIRELETRALEFIFTTSADAMLMRGATIYIESLELVQKALELELAHYKRILTDATLRVMATPVTAVEYSRTLALAFPLNILHLEKDV